MMDVQGDYQSSIVPANMRSNQGLFLTTNIPKRDLFCQFFLKLFLQKYEEQPGSISHHQEGLFQCLFRSVLKDGIETFLIF